MRYSCAMGLLLATVGLASPLTARQVTVPPSDTLANIQNRSVEELVAALPGRPTELASLLAVADRQSLTLAGEIAVREIAVAAVTGQRGRFDPAFRLGSSVATSGVPAGPTARRFSAGVGTELPWGTLVDMGWEGGSNLDFIDDPAIRYRADLSLSVSQPLLEGWGVARAPLRAARARSEAASLDYDRAREQVLAQAELLYWNLAEAEAVEAVLQRSLELAEALLFRNRQLAERDLVAEVDVITAESGVELRRASLIDARRARGDASDALIFAVYGSGAADQLLDESLPLKTATPAPRGVGDAEADPARAMEQRRDLAARRAAFEAASEVVRQARSGLRPGLFLDGSWLGANRAASRGNALSGVNDNAAWSLGLRMSLPLGNLFDRAAFEQASLTQRLRRIDVELTENTVRQDLRLASRGVQAGVDRLAAADAAAVLGTNQLRAEQQRLDLGLGDSFRLLQTEETAVRAALASVQARFDLARAITYLRLARGEVLAGR